MAADDVGLLVVIGLPYVPIRSFYEAEKPD
jgi:hypothetical protein